MSQIDLSVFYCFVNQLQPCSIHTVADTKEDNSNSNPEPDLVSQLETGTVGELPVFYATKSSHKPSEYVGSSSSYDGEDHYISTDELKPAEQQANINNSPINSEQMDHSHSPPVQADDTDSDDSAPNPDLETRGKDEL